MAKVSLQRTEKGQTEAASRQIRDLTEASLVVQRIGHNRRLAEESALRTTGKMLRAMDEHLRDVARYERAIESDMKLLEEYRSSHYPQHRSVKTDAGSFGVCVTQAKVELLRPESEVVELLRSLGLKRLLRIRYEVSKNRVAENPKLVKGLAGTIRIRPKGEAFYVQVEGLGRITERIVEALRIDAEKLRAKFTKEKKSKDVA